MRTLDPDPASPELPLAASLSFSTPSAVATPDNSKQVYSADCDSKFHPNHFFMLGPHLDPCFLNLEQGWPENAEESVSPGGTFKLSWMSASVLKYVCLMSTLKQAWDA